MRVCQVDFCVICQSDIGKDEKIFSICDNFHGFHEGCLVEWNNQKQVCPICMQSSEDRSSNSNFIVSSIHSLSMRISNFIKSFMPRNGLFDEDAPDEYMENIE